MSDWIIAQRDVGNGETIIVHPLTFGRARLSIGPTNEQWFRDGW